MVRCAHHCLRLQGRDRGGGEKRDEGGGKGKRGLKDDAVDTGSPPSFIPFARGCGKKKAGVIIKANKQGSSWSVGSLERTKRGRALDQFGSAPRFWPAEDR